LVDLPNSFVTLSLVDDLLAVIRVSHPDSKMADMKSHADSPKGSSCLMLLAVRASLRGKYPSSYWIVPEAKLRFK